MTNDTAALAAIAQLIQLTVMDVRGRALPNLADDLLLVHATSFRILHIGENASRVSLPCKARHPSIPWRSIVAMRNILAHQHDIIDPGALLDVVANHLEPLAVVCEAEMKN